VIAVLTAIIAFIAIVSAVLQVMHAQMMAAERRDWAAERRMLIDRAIAAHTGEVVALDRAHNGQPREERERPLIEGLS
jgi:hypothetical protein